MAPVPQEPTIELVAAPVPGDAPPAPDAVVITGMSGLLPGCLNVQEFAEKLYNKENLVQKYDPRWHFEHPELHEYYGRIPGLDRFDAQFFMVHYRMGNTLDAMARKVLENTYQAIFDAGISPAELSSQRVGVYIGVGATESEKGCAYTEIGLGILGCNRAMLANRVSYWLNGKGPSMVMDASCCSSLSVFEKAYNDITTGVCDAAVVGASKVLLHPHSIIHYQRLIPYNEDGKMKCYGDNADGQSCSEAINVFILQKYKDSKRVYASLCYAKTQYGVVENKEYMNKFGFERDPKCLAKFLRDFYTEAGIPPSLVEYVEGFGAAVPEADKSELQAIEEVFCKDRSNPLLLGSVMSNIGYTEAASGSSAILKVLLAYQRGELAANLHCESPRQDIEAIKDGRIRIPAEHQRFRRSYAAVNGLSVTGINGHVLLAGHYRPKDFSRYQSEIPYLVAMSGRIESAVQKLIDNFKSHKIDAEEIALFHNIHKYRINGHLARGFGIFSTNAENETIALREKADYYDDAQRPLWFVYSGMGSQWVGMGAQLMRIPVFAAAIERCRKVLEPKGVDIIRILTSPEEDIYDNILHSFVGIAAVQIGLTDVLTLIGLVPDKIIGHSVGELGCAYADGCLTAEEMILAAYCRGRVSQETSFIVGSMAAVGLGYEKILTMLPPEIEVACHNGPESSTISGPAIVMREFVAQLTAKGIFAKEVPCSNIAYHSRYIAKAGPGLLNYLNETIKTPKLRSERWVSTSVPQNRWHEDVAKYSSAEYHTNNLLSPVLFEETARLIPNNAVVVEIAPHGLLQAILKRSLPVSCKHIPLTQRRHSNNILFLLEAIGNLYMNGYNANIAALYPQVEFPVSTETPSLSHLIEWVYADHWKLCLFVPVDRAYSSVYKPIITTYDDEYTYLAGHVIEGTRSFPFAAALVLVWDTLSMSLSKPRRSLPVKLSNIHLHVQPCLTDVEALHLTVTLQKGTGRFEVFYDYGLIAEGYIVALAHTVINLELTEKDSLTLTSHDVYKLLHEKGYDYKCDGIKMEKITYMDKPYIMRQAADLKALQFFPFFLQEDADIFTTLYIFMQIIKENLYDKTINILDIVWNKPSIIDSIQDLLIGPPEIKHELTRVQKTEILSAKKISQKPDVLILNDLLSDRQGQWGGEYYIPLPANVTSKQTVALGSTKIGRLDSLNWVDVPEVSGGVSVKVYYAAVNTYDVKRARAEIPLSNENDGYGLDFSGITNRGERVFGIARDGSIRNQVTAQLELLWPVPDHWGLEDAATVPLPYLQAFYCLTMKTEIREGMRVLIHGGAGALGQAAISIALAKRCEVFTTVSDISKKKFLKQLFPELKASHIGNSRDGSFSDMILNATGGRGCHIVINNLKGQLKNASLSCCSSFGTTLDTVQIHTRDNFTYGMFNMTKARSYVPIDVMEIFESRNMGQLKKLHLLVAKGISEGYVRPLSRVTYSPQEVSRAFRLVAASNHRGRVLICIADEDVPVTSLAQPRLVCSHDHQQLLISDEDVLCLHVADRLISRGAQKLRLLKKLQEHFTDTSKEDLGLGAYFNAIEADELVTSADFVLMTTLLPSLGTNPGDIDTSNPHLYIIPGVEGYHNRFNVLCERLKMPAAVLNPSIDDMYTNVPELAQKLVNIMVQRLKNKETFYLLGYEMGVLVALEMAVILESYGLSGTVYCLGGTPEDIQTALEINLKGMSDHKLQDTVLQHLTSLMTGHRIPELTDQLQEAKNWQSKVELCVKTCRGQAPYTSQFIRTYLKAAYNRIELTRNHRVRPHTLRSKIVILRANLRYPFNQQSMARFSKQPISVHEIQSSISLAPKNLQCSTIINKYLDPAALEAFENRNHCDSYTINNHLNMKFVSQAV
ncbi:fatty acid synthase-like [Cydia strobilella]|uniref:fatty acid synthase-like n=1 Tax=Cydia strobilella TaxID=1100964 RepID=UPI003005BE3A